MQGSVRVYPGEASLIWNNSWANWTQEAGENDPLKQRAAFMGVKVPSSFLTRFCDTAIG